MAKHHRRIESRFKRPQRSPDGPGTNARERDALLDLKLSPDNQEPFKPVTAEPAEFTLEAGPVFAHAASRQVRRRMGALGEANRGQRCLIKGFALSRGDIRLLFNPLFKWGWLELKEGWRSWWQPRENKVPVRIVAMREQRETVGDSSRL